MDLSQGQRPGDEGGRPAVLPAQSKRQAGAELRRGALQVQCTDTLRRKNTIQAVSRNELNSH